MSAIADGTYEAFVIDVQPSDGGGARVELTLLAGEHKGEVVAVRSPSLDPDDLSVLGVGATLSVADGVPSVTFDGT